MESSRSSPTDALLDWYRSLPVDQRQDIAVLVSFCPGFELAEDDLDRDVVTERFAERVRGYATGMHREAASLLALRAAIQMFLIDERGTRGGWREKAAMLTELAEKSNSDTFRTQAAQMKFRGEQWIVSCEKWAALIAGPLSDAAIRDLTDPRHLVAARNE